MKSLKIYQKNKFDKILFEFSKWEGSPLLNMAFPKITEEMNFRDDLGFDSLDELEFVMEIEKQFECSIPDSKAENVKTIKDAYSLLAECL